MKRMGKHWRAVGCQFLFAALATVGLLAGSALAGEQGSLHVLVVKEDNGNPVANAAVVLHAVNRKGKQARGGYELKTNHDGQTSFDGIPYGALRIQVLVPGFQTYGGDFDIGKTDLYLTIKLKRPQGQYSLYDRPDPKFEPIKPDAKKPEGAAPAKPDTSAPAKPDVNQPAPSEDAKPDATKPPSEW